MRLHPRLLPSHLVELLARRDTPRIPSADRFEAALLFSDISGFTSLTERLQGTGRAGAEEMSDLVRAKFRSLLAAVRREGGSVVNFAGDGVFCLFPGAGAVGRASRAAERIRATFARSGRVETSVGTVELAISQYVHWGEVRGFHLGRSGRALYLAAGPAVQALARLEARPARGEVLLSDAARRRRRAERGRTATPAGRTPAGGAWRAYCGRHLAGVPAGFDGDFRPVTALFVESRGHALAYLQELVLRLQDVLDRFGGVLISPDVSAHGARWLCAFGAPVIHEDDPERAVRAALDLVGKDPRVRAAVHAGTVAAFLMGTPWRQSFELLGDAINTAARAMVKTPWGEVTVTTGVRSVVRGVQAESRGLHQVKGKAQPLELHRATGIAAPGASASFAGPMSGRRAELARLERALEAGGVAMGVGAEAGMGKSRLKWELARAAHARGIPVFEARMSPFGASTWDAAAELVRGVLALAPGAELPELSRAAAAGGLAPVRTARLADVLGLEPGEQAGPVLDPRSRRQANHAALVDLLLHARAAVPQLLILEDMHWANATTRELAERLIAEVGGTRTLLLLLYRPEFPLPAGLETLALPELSAADVRQMLRVRLGAATRTIAELLLERSEGNPFYVEEGIRHLLELSVLVPGPGGHRLTRALRADELPSRLEALIRVRLDRLPASTRRIAQRAAVLGRTFQASLLHRMVERPGEVAAGLAELEQSSVAFPVSADGDAWVFKHALTRDAAYASVMLKHRRPLHRQAALAIESAHGSDASVHSALLGHHWLLAGDRPRGRLHLRKGARLAASHFALDQAEQLFRQYVRLREGVDAELVQVRNELGHMVLYGQGRMKEARAEHRRALREATRIGDRAGMAECHWRLGMVSWQTDRKHAALHFETGLGIAREIGDRRVEGGAIHYLGMLRHQEGDLAAAARHYAQAREVFEATGNRVEMGKVIGVISILRYSEGRMPESLQLAEEALRVARAEGDRKTEGDWTSNIGMVHAVAGRYTEGREMFEASLAIRQEVGDERGEGLTLNNLGLCLLHAGEPQEARGILERAVRLNRKVGNLLHEVHALDALASVQAASGELAAALASTERSVAMALQVGSPRDRSFSSAGRAWIRFLIDGDVRAARTELEEADGGLRQAGAAGERVTIVARLGHLALAAGGPATAFLEEARRVLASAGLTDAGHHGRTLGRLVRAQRAFEEGAPLVRGLALEDLPPARGGVPESPDP